MHNKVLVVAEIGVNHNGDIAQAKKLVGAAKACGCDLVKFQKRTVESVYTRRQLARPLPNPFGSRFVDLKNGLEFGVREYEQIDRYCRRNGIPWFASCWDSRSVEELSGFSMPYLKVPSLRLRDESLLRAVRAAGRPVILSCGACGEDVIRRAAAMVGRTRIAFMLQCTAIYPPQAFQLDLGYMRALRSICNVSVGFSCHYPDPCLGVFAAGLGAEMIEFHLTLDRWMWGSDHAASLVPAEMAWLVRALRTCAAATGDGRKHVYAQEKRKLMSYRAAGRSCR